MKANIKFRDWLILAEVAGYKPEGTAQRPLRIGKVRTPENFNDLTFGQVVDLSNAGEDVAKVVMITTGMEREKVMKSKATEVVLYILWATEQVAKINRLFAKLKGTPTATEVQAGCDRLNFGIFGMVDAYARRMGITDHDEVLRTPWMVVYKCMKMDYDTREYERRYNKILQDEIKRKKK